jgi:hypothetical protein
MEQILYLLLEVATNTLIVAMLFWFIFWDCEKTNPVRRYLIPRIYRPFAWLGLNVEWTMFTPDPPRQDIWPMVVFTMSDGSKNHWVPRPYLNLSVLEKIKYKKILKYYFQVTSASADNQIKRDFVEYILRIHQSTLNCTKLELYSVSRKTPSLAKQGEINEAYQKLIFTFLPAHSEVSS